MSNYRAAANRYDGMGYRRSGRSGLQLPLVSMGLWHNFGGVDVYENGRSILLRSFDLGITHFDLANNYGPPAGSAEENFGKIMKNDLAPYRDELIISTKAGYYMWQGPYGEWGSRKYLISSLDQSLKHIAEQGKGVAVLLNCGESAAQLLAQFEGTARASQAPERGRMDLRTYGVGAQILRECGVHRMNLMGNPRRMPSMTGYGLEIVGYTAKN